MKHRKFKLSLLAGLLAVVMAFGVIGDVLPHEAEAASSSALKEQLDALKEEKKQIQSQLKDLESQLSDNLGDMEAIVAQKNVIDQEIFMLYEQVENINEQIAAYSLLIADKQEELDAAEAHLAELNEKNKERVRAMEEDGNLSYWSVLFKANSFSDFLDRLNMIEEIAAADQRRLTEMSEAAKVVAETKASLETEKAGLETNKQELLASQESLKEKRKEADGLLAQLVAEGEKYEALIAAAEEEEEKILNNIDDVEEDYEAAKYKEWLATSVPPTTSASASSNSSSGGTAGAPTNTAGITWLKPCTYTRVSSPYGWRIHPVYGDWRFHSGIDLSASQGTPIVATRSGKVTVAKYSSTAGYYVTIDHQDGFESKYLHMTHYIVSVGDYVTAGQVIGYVGSTGTSTGPHLHFTICYNGSSVNPSDYISF